MVSKLLESPPDPEPDFLPIPDPGVKKALDPGSGSATLHETFGAGGEAAHGEGHTGHLEQPAVPLHPLHLAKIGVLYSSQLHHPRRRLFSIYVRGIFAHACSPPTLHSHCPLAADSNILYSHSLSF
jgi:hypothetical protein